MRRVVYGIMVLLGGLLVASGRAEPTGHKLDWFAWGQTRASPYLTDVRALCDGDPGTICAHMDGPQAGGWVALAFPETVQVTVLRFRQDAGRTADGFELRADLEGRGDYSERVAVVRHEAPLVNAWIEIPVDRRVRGLRLRALSGSVGYRSPYPHYQELEVYTREPVAVPAPVVEVAPRVLEVGVDACPPGPVRRDIAFTPCIDLWMAGIASGGQMPETGAAVAALSDFQNVRRRLRDLDAQGVRMFLEGACVENKLPWTSALADHHGRDTLRGVLEALHAEGLTGSLFLHAWISPFQDKARMLPMPDRRWDYPYEQSSLVAAKGLYPGYEPGQYPCIISDKAFRTQWFELLKEGVERGLDGVYVIPDEYYFKGHDLDSYTCPSCRREFQKRYGYADLPTLGPGRSGHAAVPGVAPDPRRMVDTEHFRKWKLFEYEMLAELFNDVAGRLKAINPKLVVISSANLASVYVTNRGLEHGLAFDLIGRGEHFTAVQLYGTVPVGLGSMGMHTALARRMAGSYRTAELLSSIQSLEFKDLNPETQAIRFLGYVLPHVMNGARRIDLYRLNYVDGPWSGVVGRGLGLVRTLESWGIRESVSAADTCVLHSRASEDWWQVRAQSLMGMNEDGGTTNLAAVAGAPLLHFEEQIGTVRTLASDEAELKLDFERFRGMYAGKGMESVLIENGVQYEVRYTDRPETLDDLGRYRLLILPFSYSMSTNAFSRIQAAVEAGARLLIVDQLAPTDAFGTPHPEPLLKALVGHPRVRVAKINLAEEGMRPSVRQRLARGVADMRGGEAGRFNPNGARVEYLVRKTADGLILYLANWEPSRDAEVVLGLPLAEGAYRLEVVCGSRPERHPGLVDGRQTVNAGDLRTLGVRVPAGDVMLIRVAHGRDEG